MSPSYLLCAKAVEAAYTPEFMSDPSSLDLTDLGLTMRFPIVGKDFFFTETIPFGFLAEDAQGNLLVALRGTDNALEGVRDLEVLLVDAPSNLHGQMPVGPKEVYQTLKKQGDSFALSNRLISESWGKPVNGSVPTLTIAGHSLGGVLAAALAGSLGGVNLVTLGSPTPGDGSFSASVFSRCLSCARLVDSGDPIPGFYEPKPPFHHIGTAIIVGESPSEDPFEHHAIDNYVSLLSETSASRLRGKNNPKTKATR